MLARAAVSSHHEQDFGDFESLIAPWEVAYIYATNSYVALRLPEGPRLLFGRVVLEPTRTGINERPFRLETEHIIAARFVMDTMDHDVVSLLEKVRAAEVPCTDGSVRLLLEDGSSFSTYFNPLYHPFVSFGPRQPSIVIRGIAKHKLVSQIADARQLDWELKAADAPYDGLDELLAHCGLPTLMQMGDSTTLEIVAKSPAWIDTRSTIRGSEAAIECHVAIGLGVDKLRIGYKVFQKEHVDRGSEGGAGLQWRQNGDIRTGTCRVPTGDSSLLQAFLSYEGVCLHQWWVMDPQKRLNPRHAIHQIFDQDLEILKRMLLRPEADKPYEFENAVSALLSMLGFSVVNYGRIPKLQRGPDIIAVSPSDHIGVIECTVGLLDENDKLAKLVQRTKLVREKLNEAGYSHLQLQSVIVTPLSRDEVAANLETAGKHHIAVVCKEDLEGLLHQVSLPPNPDRLFEDAKRLIPSSPQVSLFEESAS